MCGAIAAPVAAGRGRPGQVGGHHLLKHAAVVFVEVALPRDVGLGEAAGRAVVAIPMQPECSINIIQKILTFLSYVWYNFILYSIAH